MRLKLIVLTLLLCYCGAAAAYGPLRCQGKIIRPEATMAEVLMLCGPPDTRIVEEVPVRAGSVNGFSRLLAVTALEQWVYDRGWGRFPAVLRFHDGELRRIDYLPYRSGAR